MNTLGPVVLIDLAPIVAKRIRVNRPLVRSILTSLGTQILITGIKDPIRHIDYLMAEFRAPENGICAIIINAYGILDGRVKVPPRRSPDIEEPKVATPCGNRRKRSS
jgi:hypothetical protein